MSIRKRIGRYQVRVRVGDGSRVERTLPPGATLADARALEAAIKRARIDVATGRKPRRLIDDALDQYEAQARGLKSYALDLRYRFAVVREYTAGRPLEDIPAVAATLTSSGIKAGLQPATINRYLSVLRRAGYLAVKWGWTDLALGERVGMLAGERARDCLLSPAQVRAIADAAGQAGDTIRLLALTGLRRSELLQLTAESVQHGQIVLDARTKSGKGRVIPLAPEAAQIARRAIPCPVTLAELRRAFEHARQAVGLPQARLHDLRHAFGSWLAQAGTPATVIRDLMGHSTLAVTSRYTHATRDDLRTAVKSLRLGSGRGHKKGAQRA